MRNDVNNTSRKSTGFPDVAKSIENLKAFSERQKELHQLRTVEVTEPNKKGIKGSDFYFRRIYNPNPWEWPDGTIRRHNFEREQIDAAYHACCSSIDADPDLPVEYYTPGYILKPDKTWDYYNGFYRTQEPSFDAEGKLYKVPEYPKMESLSEFIRKIRLSQRIAINKVTKADIENTELMRATLIRVYYAKLDRYYKVLHYMADMYDMTVGLTERNHRLHQEALGKDPNKEMTPEEREAAFARGEKYLKRYRERREREQQESRQSREASDDFFHLEDFCSNEEEHHASEHDVLSSIMGGIGLNDLDDRPDDRDDHRDDRRYLQDYGYDDPYYDRRPREPFYHDPMYDYDTSLPGYNMGYKGFTDPDIFEHPERYNIPKDEGNKPHFSDTSRAIDLTKIYGDGNNDMETENKFREGLRKAANGEIPLDDTDGDDDHPFGYGYDKEGNRLEEIPTINYYDGTCNQAYYDYCNGRTPHRIALAKAIWRSQGLSEKEIMDKLYPPKEALRNPYYDDDDDFPEESYIWIKKDGKVYRHTICGKNSHIPRYMYDAKYNAYRDSLPEVKDLPPVMSPAEASLRRRIEKFRGMSGREFLARFGEFREAVDAGERRSREDDRLVNSYDHGAYKECMIGMSTKFPYSVNSGLEHLEIAMKTDQVAKLLERERIIRHFNLRDPKALQQFKEEVVKLNKAWIPYLTREIPFNDATWTIEDREAYRLQKMLYEKGMDNKDVEALIKNGSFTVTPEMKLEGFIRQHYSVDYYTKEESEKILNSKEYKDFLAKMARDTGMSVEKINDNMLKRRKFYEHILRQHPDLKAKTYDQVYKEDILK